MDTQKNYVSGESISVDISRLLFGCPVVACTCCFLHLRDNNADLDTPICVYFDRRGAAGKSATSTHLVSHLWLWDANIVFAKLGFHPHEIVSHSLRSGSAMTLNQSSQSYSTIKVVVRWYSDTFLVYLQGQVATFAKCVSAAIK